LPEILVARKSYDADHMVFELMSEHSVLNDYVARIIDNRVIPLPPENTGAAGLTFYPV